VVRAVAAMAVAAAALAGAAAPVAPRTCLDTVKVGVLLPIPVGARGAARTDVDGDGRHDRVSAALRRLPSGRCTFVVTVALATGRRATIHVDRTGFPAGERALVAAEAIAPGRADALLVALYHSCCIDTYTLVRWAGASRGLVTAGKWEQGGTIGTGAYAVDCTAPHRGRIVAVATEYLSPHRVRLWRTTWRLDAAGLRRLGSDAPRTYADTHEPPWYRRLAGKPFGTCRRTH
jgi:hypothetical protein